MNTYELTLSLSNGTIVSTQVQTELGHAEFVDEVAGTIEDTGKPGWRILGSIIVFNQALSACQVEPF